jgi:hypothetical protein
VTDAIRPPIVTDVFAIDAMTEMLESPLRLISYIHRRSGYSGKLKVPDELTALSFHLRTNLWLEDKYDMVSLSDDVSCDLNAAMTVRREGLPGQRTPEGILTKFVGTTIEEVFRQIEKYPDSDAVEFAFQVLTFDEETIRRLTEGIDNAVRLYKEDGENPVDEKGFPNRSSYWSDPDSVCNRRMLYTQRCSDGEEANPFCSGCSSPV